MCIQMSCPIESADRKIHSSVSEFVSRTALSGLLRTVGSRADDVCAFITISSSPLNQQLTPEAGTHPADTVIHGGQRSMSSRQLHHQISGNRCERPDWLMHVMGKSFSAYSDYNKEKHSRKIEKLRGKTEQNT